MGSSIVNRITGSHTEDPDEPDHSVVLMRGHGFTTAASSIELAVYQAIYTQTTAKVQTTAMMTQNAYFGAKLDGKVDDSGNIKQASVRSGRDLHYLTSQESTDASNMNMQVAGRSWQMWEREVSASALYVNDMKKPAKTESDITVR